MKSVITLYVTMQLLYSALSFYLMVLPLYMFFFLLFNVISYPPILSWIAFQQNRTDNYYYYYFFKIVYCAGIQTWLIAVS